MLDFEWLSSMCPYSTWVVKDSAITLTVLQESGMGEWESIDLLCACQNHRRAFVSFQDCF